MAFRATVKLDSKIFKPGEVRRELSKAVLKAAAAFQISTREKMVNSPHTGAVVTRVRGESFAATRQRSRRGERPQRQTGNLERNVKLKKISEVSAAVFVDEAGAPYAERLVGELGRIIVSRGDVEEAEIALARDVNQRIQSLL